MKTLFQFILLSAILLTACKTKSVKEQETVSDNYKKEKSVEDLSKEILNHLKNKDYAALSPYIHPEKGVLFVPYGFIDTQNSVVIPANKFLDLNGYEEYYWGDYDGTGDSISLSIDQYYDKFVYDGKYLDSSEIYSDTSIHFGNSIDNTKAVFPNANYVEYYIKGTAQYSEMDWKSLRLVFEKQNGHNYLVAIIHNQWTI